MNIKERIIKRVNDINDPELLNELLSAIELEHEIENFHELNSSEKKAIDEGIVEADKGLLKSSEDAKALMNQWLKK
ncbi:hypothetical protein GCM10027429_11500 [Marivirga atlantica]|jgi:predicted transcriptional regulator|uniref:Addiction module component n=1 Tax=Marivirga atlantica TaxID=1548457 RepID=A0A937DGG6_9BACT|nr:hypothetical protein [Marivirga atlantica]MBL0764763.1 hypothetical protein [Marivirga atlantica]